MRQVFDGVNSEIENEKPVKGEISVDCETGWAGGTGLTGLISFGVERSRSVGEGPFLKNEIFFQLS